MPIKVGDRLPDAKFRVMTPEGPAWKTTDDIFKGKKVALFAVPGAFTGTCHKIHVPSILRTPPRIKAKGVNTIAVTSVNDVFVMDAWKKASGAETSIFWPTATVSSPRRSISPSMLRVTALASARGVMPCWSRMAW